MAKKNAVKTAVVEEDLSGTTVGPKGINESEAPRGSKDNPIEITLNDNGLEFPEPNSQDGPLMVIEHAKVQSKEIYIEYNTNMNGAGADIKLKSGCIPHKDLVDAMSQLSVHLVHLCDLQEFQGVEPDQVHLCSNIKISSFTISGDDEHEGIVISGSKKFGNKQINLNTPFTKFSNEHDPYQWSRELSATVQLIIEELKLFINHGKCGETQLDLEFPDNEESSSDQEISPVENKKSEEDNLPS